MQIPDHTTYLQEQLRSCKRRLTIQQEGSNKIALCQLMFEDHEHVPGSGTAREQAAQGHMLLFTLSQQRPIAAHQPISVSKEDRYSLHDTLHST